MVAALTMASPSSFLCSSTSSAAARSSFGTCSSTSSLSLVRKLSGVRQKSRLQFHPLAETIKTRSEVVRSCLRTEAHQHLNFPSIIGAIEQRVLVTSSDGKIQWKGTLSAAVLATATFLQVGDSALASMFGPRFRDLPEFRTTSEGWVVVGITSLVAAFVYFIVIPLLIYYYLHERWYKRSMPETFFQFMLVFIFFPGLLLLAPFINFRPLPKDGTKAP